MDRLSMTAVHEINKLMTRYGVKFGIYRNGEFIEQLFPYDPIPRVIARGEFAVLSKGLVQRVNALNCFLADIYGKGRIVADKVIPEEFIYISKGYLQQCSG
ncbi:MAG: circularly permuted type 2 ATP-grasp protein, partial [Chitinispirillia bacterium]|nr:circularly permuted type 2 ATP-grasp protein [Chitinispirillia bacterium]MCL2241979.1 circularly permuted type 2 ATP-grasp protein [Chitinispirillia bacterium]